MTEHRVRFAALFDEETAPHNERFRRATRIGPRDRVLDVGCGTGQTTREAARATSGDVVGVDVSVGSLKHARGHTDAPNVTYLHADAQTHPFPPAAFDVCVSRFGTMFFADPVAAFTNIARAVRPGGRLVLLVWQLRSANEWVTSIRAALGGGRLPDDEGAFSLGDPAAVRRVLSAAGFGDVELADVHEPVRYGPTPEVAAEFVLGFLESKELVAAGGSPDALRALLAAHHSAAGVRFDSRAWIVTARRD